MIRNEQSDIKEILTAANEISNRLKKYQLEGITLPFGFFNFKQILYA